MVRGEKVSKANTGGPIYQVVRYEWGCDMRAGVVVFQTVNKTAAEIYRNAQQQIHASAVVERQALGLAQIGYFVYGVRIAPPEAR